MKTKKEGKSKSKKRNIVVIGGGTGTFVVLTGLKKYDVNLSAIVTMADSGGSSGKLRDEYGVLPPGDIRQCLVALSDSDMLMRELFLYRYNNGTFDGQNFGNIFISTLEKMTGNIKDAIEAAGKILGIKGKVIPVTTDNVQLHAELENGQIIKGETNIDEPEHDGNLKITKAFLVPEPKVNEDAIQAIKQAELIVIGPGDVYTSIVPNLLVKGIVEAIKSSKAKKVFVLNLMTKYGQTSNLSVKEHVKIIEKYLGKDVLDVVIINNGKVPEDIIKAYEKDKEYSVRDDVKNTKYKIIRADVLKSDIHKKKQGDYIKRSLIRHDPDKLAKILMELVT